MSYKRTIKQLIMKRILFSLILTSCFLLINNTSKACVDYHPDSVVINILADTVNCNFILEISNLNMFGGNPNDFCSCGITNALPPGSTIEWVAFVDAETQEPVEGFDLWSFSGAAGDSWEDSDLGTIDWNGFVSGVNSAGIVAGQDVNLWIILEMDSSDPQWSWLCNADEGSMWEFFGQFSFGTDEWDDDNGVLANSHQSITNFSDSYLGFFYITPEIYDEHVEILNNFYNGIEELDAKSISIYPNPSNGIITVSSIDRKTKLVLRDLLGNQVGIRFTDYNQIDLSGLPDAIYILEIQKKHSKVSKRIVVN